MRGPYGHVNANRLVAPLVFIVFTAISLSACDAPTSVSTSTNTLKLHILAPATVPPVVRECSQKLVHSSDGNTSPLVCSGGGLNVRAWKFYSSVGTDVMSLGRRTTIAMVVSAMCNDVTVDHATFLEETTAAKLASYYYGWDFKSPSIERCSY